MKLYLISQSENNNYDTYDSAVVAAPDEEAATRIHPGTEKEFEEGQKAEFNEWCSGPSEVTAEYIGEAKEGTEQGVILASYNAG